MFHKGVISVFGNFNGNSTHIEQFNLDIIVLYYAHKNILVLVFFSFSFDLDIFGCTDPGEL